MMRLIFSFLLVAGFHSALFASASPAFCKRTFSSYQFTENGEIIVTVEITKGAATGIAKLVEDIPFGLKAYEGESLGGVFSFEQQKLKIVWLTIPNKDIFTVTYKLKPVGNMNKEYHIVGRFLYVVADSREEYILSDAILYGKTDVSASVENKVITEDVKVDNTQNYTYKVQLGAYSVKKDAAVFNGLQDISVEETNGVYRYFTGSFATKEEAMKRAQEAKEKGFPGAHVKPFKDGKMVMN
ncbi:MAG: SPOR domain-containing protein [Flavobacteriales bacterium]